MTEAPLRKRRCAVYTRKSSEEGLEQEFNCLDAQREAGLAYIVSQKSEGWIALADRYDDGGVSGGTLERPALQRLLRDIEAGKIDVVVVYKIDRLSRSLMDFARLVEAFERHNVTFVSVTQQFNTTTSMGRLTLNILLSFAQFEREVIGERIRDKVLASRRKGLWMGGSVPLGYRVEARKLVVVEAEALLVRKIFTRFAALGSALAVARELNAAGEVTKRWTANGLPRGGRAWTKGDIYKALANRTYLGLAVHKGAGLPRRARRHRRPGPLGPGARHHGRAEPPAGGDEPGQGGDAPEGPDLRPQRPGDVALAHQAPRPHPPLLRHPRGDRRGLRYLPGPSRTRGRRRERRSGTGAATADHARDGGAGVEGSQPRGERSARARCWACWATSAASGPSFSRPSRRGS